MKKIAVGVADDHPIVVLGVLHLLQSSPDIEVVFTTERIEDLLRLLVETPVDVLLCDYEFRDDPQADGLRLLESARRVAPDTRIIVFSSHVSPYLISSAMEAGASGFIGKKYSDFANLAYAIRSFAHKKFFLPNSLQQRLWYKNGFSMREDASDQRCARPGGLSDKETTVARLICEGLSLADIAHQLRRSPKTISNQKNAAMKKLGVRNDVELCVAMREIFSLTDA